MAPRAIWEIFPHFCGNANRKRLMVVLKVYSDESGKGDPRTFVMAGFIARAEVWAEFENDWNAVLARPPAIPYFHMADAVASGDFDRIAALAALIRKHKLSGISVLIYMPDYDLVVRNQISRRFDNPYFFALIRQMELAVEWQIDHNIDEPMDFIFDEQRHESDFLQWIWSQIEPGWPDWIRRRFGNRPIHLDDKSNPALQAADMLAWTLRRISEQPFPPFLAGIFEGVTIRQDRWTVEKLAKFVSYIKFRNMSQQRMTAHDFAKAAQNKDALYTRMNRAIIARAKPGEAVGLLSIPAKGIGKFLLVDKCPLANTPHLHKRSGDQCLAGLAS